jgi:hypothetical protein
MRSMSAVDSPWLRMAGGESPAFQVRKRRREGAALAAGYIAAVRSCARWDDPPTVPRAGIPPEELRALLGGPFGENVATSRIFAWPALAARDLSANRNPFTVYLLDPIPWRNSAASCWGFRPGSRSSAVTLLHDIPYRWRSPAVPAVARDAHLAVSVQQGRDPDGQAVPSRHRVDLRAASRCPAVEGHPGGCGLGGAVARTGARCS